MLPFVVAIYHQVLSKVYYLRQPANSHHPPWDSTTQQYHTPLYRYSKGRLLIRYAFLVTLI